MDREQYRHLAVPKGHNAPNFAWQMVTCHKCRKEFRCTPDSDYFTVIPNTVPKDAESGFCWDCLLEINESKAQSEPQIGDPLFRGDPAVRLKPPFR